MNAPQIKALAGLLGHWAFAEEVPGTLHDAPTCDCIHFTETALTFIQESLLCILKLLHCSSLQLPQHILQLLAFGTQAGLHTVQRCLAG